MAITPPQLDYAPPVSRRKKWAWRGALLLLVVGLAVASYGWGPPVWRKAQILYWQHACMTYSPSPDTVVYEEEPIKAAELLAKKAEYQPYILRRGNGLNSKPAAVNAAALCPNCYAHFQLASGIPGAGSNMFTMNTVGRPATVFLHERQSPAGHQRLVILTYHPETDTFTSNFIEDYNYDAEAITPATLRSQPSVPLRSFGLDVMSSWPRHPPLARMYAGQPDPVDPSHFTIRYQMWGQEDVLDGRLDDNDNVTITPRHPPRMPVN
jgi:hypothetical protein